MPSRRSRDCVAIKGCSRDSRITRVRRQPTKRTTMAAKSLLFALVIVSVASGLNAWPWDRKTTTTTKAPPPSPQQFLTQVQAARDVVGIEIQKSQQLLKQAQDHQEKSKAITKVPVDLTTWRDTFRARVTAEAATYEKQGVQVAQCISAYDTDMAKIIGFLTKKAGEMIESDFKDIEATATSKASQLVSAMDALLVRAQQEAASPTYGDNVEDILAQTARTKMLAEWGNKHIPAKLRNLFIAADTTIFLYLGHIDAQAVGDYAGFCMSQAAHDLEH